VIALGFFCTVLLAAAASDAASYRIPNWMPGVLAVGALALAFPQGSDEWVSRGASFLAVVILTLSLYLARGLGGGDVKLLCAASLWMPFATLPVFVLVLGMAGGGQALATLGARRLAPASAGPPALRRRMPYGVSIALGGLAWAFAQVAG
jgi:prepilin peptidase CpaA